MDPVNLLIVEWIQSFRHPILDGFFLIITEFGDETVFLVVAAILYWTIDKRFAYRFMLFFLYGSLVNGSLKFLTNSPRPHTEYPERITLVGEGSGGTSLPSGHAQNSSMMALVLAEKSSSLHKHFSTILTVIVGLVMLSRLYLGEHYLSDVLFGLAISYALYAGVRRVLQHRVFPKYSLWIVASLFGLITLFTNDKNMVVALATIAGIQFGIPLEQQYIRFNERVDLKTAIVRLVIGVGFALALRIGIKALFESLGWYSITVETNPLLLDQVLDFVRYFLIVMWMTLGAPLLFKWMAKKPA
jgi:membrane-associated phospholipid phosphatase